MDDIDNAVAMARKFDQKAREILAALAVSMERDDWPADYRRLMWQAIRLEAARRAQL